MGRSRACPTSGSERLATASVPPTAPSTARTSFLDVSSHGLEAARPSGARLRFAGQGTPPPFVQEDGSALAGCDWRDGLEFPESPCPAFKQNKCQRSKRPGPRAGLFALARATGIAPAGWDLGPARRASESDRLLAAGHSPAFSPCSPDAQEAHPETGRSAGRGTCVAVSDMRRLEQMRSRAAHATARSPGAAKKARGPSPALGPKTGPIGHALERFSLAATDWAGSSWAFAVAVAVILAWAVTGPI